GRGGVEGHAVSQPADATIIERRRRRVRRVDAERYPKIRPGSREVEIGRHDAHDLARHAVDRDLASDDSAVRTELALPDSLSDEHHPGCIRSIFAVTEGAAEDRSRAEHG